MKIVVDATAAVSGGKVYLRHLLPHLQQQASAHEFIIFHNGELDDVAGIITSDRFQFRKVWMPGFAAENWLSRSLVKLLWRILALPWHLHRLQPELFFSNAGLAPALRPAATRILVALHNSMPLRDELVSEERSALRRGRLLLLRNMLRRTLRRCDGVIVFSEDSAQSLRMFSEKRCPELFVVRHGIDWSNRERDMPVDYDLLTRLNLSQPYLLYVSHLHRYKNIQRLIDAFMMIADEFPALHLVIVGDTGDHRYRREVMQQIAASPYEHRIHLLPGCSREQLLAIYRAATCFVHPSLAETCSFPLLEALAMGLPVAASRASALPEMAAEAALYFDPKRTDAMADTLRKLLRDESLQHELRQRAIVRATDFSWEQTAQATINVFERMARPDGLRDSLLPKSAALK